MKFKQPKLNTNFWIVIGTLIFLVLSYFFYLEFYVPAKESQIISTRFRVLDQMGDNINNKIESYDILQLKKKIEEEIFSLNELLISQRYNFSLTAIAFYVFKNLVEETYPSILSQDIQVSDLKLDSTNVEDNINQNDLKYYDQLNKTETDRYFYFKPIGIETAVGNGQSCYDTLLIRTKYENLIKGLTRNDVFAHLFIIRNGELIYSTLKSDLIIDHTTFKDGILNVSSSEPVSSKPDKKDKPAKTGIIAANPDLIQSGEYDDIRISNRNYKLFLKPVKVENEYWYLGGLMDARTFSANRRSISPWVIVILSMLLILIILGLPMIKLKVISKTEHLKTGILINSALAILLGTSALTLFLLFLFQNFSHLLNSDKRLKNLSASIDSSFNNEISRSYDQLMHFDDQYKNYKFHTLTSKFSKLEISLSVDDPTIDNILNLPKDHIAYPAVYPFAEFIFWIDGEGTQNAYLTSLIQEKGDLLDVQKRDYFKNKDEWFYPPDPTKKFRLESILSLRSGDHKVALSTRSNSGDNPVIALSAPFYSIIDPLIPKNFGFCIIDKDGEVWFHSNKNRNKMENFLSECNDNNFLKSAIYNRSSLSFNVNYYNNPHRVFVKPFDQLPLFLITFYDRESENSFHAQVLTMVIILISAFFLFIFLQVIVLLALDRQFLLKLTKNLIIKITRPRLHLVNHYRFLFRIYLVVTVVTAAFLIYMGKIESFATIYLMEIIVFTFSYHVLNDSDKKKKQRLWFSIINCAVLICINIGLFVTVEILSGLIVLAYQIILIISLYYSYEVFKKKLDINELKINKIFIRNYVMLLLCLSIIFAILPVLTFYEIAANKEFEIRARHYVVDLMKKRELRNASLNKYYAPMLQTDAAKNILQDRKNRGIYTAFLNDMNFADQPDLRGATANDKHKNSILDSLVLFMRPYYDDEIIENKCLVFNNPKNSQVQWFNYRKDSLALKYLSNTEDPKFEKQDYMWITGGVERLNFLLPFHGIEFSGWLSFILNTVFWLIIIILLFIFYKLIKFSIINIFGIDILTNYSQASFSKWFGLQVLTNKDLLFIKLSPKDRTRLQPESVSIDLRLDWSDPAMIEQSGVMINNCLEEHRAGNNQIVDFIIVLIDNFEWNYTEPGIFLTKLETLKRYLIQKDVHLIIQSALNPVIIKNYYRGIIDLQDKNDKDATIIDLAVHKHILSNLEVLMNSATSIRSPLNYNTPEEKVKNEDPKNRRSFEKYIEDELSVSEYLSQFKPDLMDYYNKTVTAHDIKKQEDLIIDKIEEIANDYYEDLFNACSVEEQYVMLDLADDLIMNHKNTKAIFGLLQKGILIKKNEYIKFMNYSFRHFVMSKLKKVDTSALEIQMGKDSGTWQGYRIMLILIIVSLVVFIAMANQDLMENLRQIFVVIGGGIAAITGILGLISRKSKSVSD